MKEYKIVCDRYERDSKKYGGKEYNYTAIYPLECFHTVFKELDKAEDYFKLSIDKWKRMIEENNSKFTEDGYVVYMEQTNYRIVYREISDWKNLQEE